MEKLIRALTEPQRQIISALANRGGQKHKSLEEIRQAKREIRATKLHGPLEDELKTAMKDIWYFQAYFINLKVLRKYETCYRVQDRRYREAVLRRELFTDVLEVNHCYRFTLKDRRFVIHKRLGEKK